MHAYICIYTDMYKYMFIYIIYIYIMCQRLFERETTPGYVKWKRQIGVYFRKTDDFRVLENKNRFEN